MKSGLCRPDRLYGAAFTYWVYEKQTAVTALHIYRSSTLINLISGQSATADAKNLPQKQSYPKVLIRSVLTPHAIRLLRNDSSSSTE